MPQAKNDPVDVLIIGSGASGAAVAWSLADTKMRIVCMEQGDWMNPAAYPTSGRDWEARQLGDFAISPNRRGRDTDYPINEDNSPIKVGNFNGVGGSTILLMHRSGQGLSQRCGCCGSCVTGHGFQRVIVMMVGFFQPGSLAIKDFQYTASAH